MNKKNLRFYEAPVAEVVELKVCSMLCLSAGSNPGDVPDEEEG